MVNARPSLLLRNTAGDTWNGSARVTGPTSLASGATTSNVWWDTEDEDSDAMHNLVTRGDQIIVVTAGLYRIDGRLAFATNATGARYGELRINNVAQSLAFDVIPGNSSTSAIVHFGGVYRLAVNDIVTVVPIQTSGGALNFAAGRMSMTWEKS